MASVRMAAPGETLITTLSGVIRGLILASSAAVPEASALLKGVPKTPA